MYGLVRILFAAAITFFTAAGAFTGGIARPPTGIALPGGPVGSAISGVVEVTPPGGVAWAGAPMASEAAARARARNNVRRAGASAAAQGAFFNSLLLRRPAGLAVGLALK